jgi:hypothetical protein
VALRRDPNNPKLWQLDGWALGFVSGMAVMQSGTDYLESLDKDAVFEGLDMHGLC